MFPHFEFCTYIKLLYRVHLYSQQSVHHFLQVYVYYVYTVIVVASMTDGATGR